MVNMIARCFLGIELNGIFRYEEILSKQEGNDSKPTGKKEEQNNSEGEDNYDDFDWDAFEKEE